MSQLTNDEILAIKRSAGLANASGVEYGGSPGATIRVTGGPVASPIPTKPTASKPKSAKPKRKSSRRGLDEIIAADAWTLRKRHLGDINRLAGDESLRLLRYELVSDARIRAELAQAGQYPKSTTLGLHQRQRNGWHNILINQNACTREEIADVVLHEIGHLRCIQIANDRSEHAAELWAQAWWDAAPTV